MDKQRDEHQDHRCNQKKSASLPSRRKDEEISENILADIDMVDPGLIKDKQIEWTDHQGTLHCSRNQSNGILFPFYDIG